MIRSSVSILCWRQKSGRIFACRHQPHALQTALLRNLSTDSDKGHETPVAEDKSERSRKRFRRMDEIPSYKDFLHRQTVLALYRQFLRTVRPLPDQRELNKQIKKEFSSLQHDDAWNRKRAIQEGQRRLKDLQATVSTSATFGQDAPAEQDEDNKVGSGWPWERKND